MSTSIEAIQQKIFELKKDMEFIKHLLSEWTELSVGAKKQLAEARKTPESEYVDLE